LPVVGWAAKIQSLGREQGIYRGEVMDIIGRLADIKSGVNLSRLRAHVERIKAELAAGRRA
jgi:hypothetical protein